MKKFIPVVMILLTAGAANAGGLVTKHATSVQLTVDSARTTAARVGNSYAISGTNVGTSDGTTAGMLSSGTISSGVYSPGTITANQLNATDGEAFSFSTSFTQGDALSTSAPTVGEFQTTPQLLLTQLELLVIWQVLSDKTVVLP